jgi:hypothetical protein
MEWNEACSKGVGRHIGMLCCGPGLERTRVAYYTERDADNFCPQIVNPKGEMKGSAITGPVGKEAAELWPVRTRTPTSKVTITYKHVAYCQQLWCRHVNGLSFRGLGMEMGFAVAWLCRNSDHNNMTHSKIVWRPSQIWSGSDLPESVKLMIVGIWSIDDDLDLLASARHMSLVYLL